MKKILSVVLVMSMLISVFCLPAQAKVGDIAGVALHTDIVVFINNFAIPSYAVNGQSVVVAEDLRNFGFDVIWNGANRSLTISRNSENTVNLMTVTKGYTTGTKYTDILETDISVWADGIKITSYAMNGYTMIPVEELTMFGQVSWVQEERALKMQVEGLERIESKQPIPKRYYYDTVVPDFGWVTNSLCVDMEVHYTGRVLAYYYEASEKVQDYINYITSQGWELNASVEDEGTWYAGYINKSLRTGVAISETDGVVFVQVVEDIDTWSAEVV